MVKKCMVLLTWGLMCDENDNLIHAKNVLLHMAVGVNDHWKMLLGYILVGGLNGSERAILFKQMFTSYVRYRLEASLNINNIDNSNDFCFNNSFTNKSLHSIIYNLKLFKNT